MLLTFSSLHRINFAARCMMPLFYAKHRNKIKVKYMKPTRYFPKISLVKPYLEKTNTRLVYTSVIQVKCMKIINNIRACCGHFTSG